MCGFAICGLAHLRSFRICDSGFGMSPRTCKFEICRLLGKVCLSTSEKKRKPAKLLWTTKKWLAFYLSFYMADQRDNPVKNCEHNICRRLFKPPSCLQTRNLRDLLYIIFIFTSRKFSCKVVICEKQI